MWPVIVSMHAAVGMSQNRTVLSSDAEKMCTLSGENRVKCTGLQQQ